MKILSEMRCFFSILFEMATKSNVTLCVEDKSICVEDFNKESVQLIEWEGLESVWLIVFLSFGIAQFGGKTLMINYLWRFAPNRPFNTMFAKDQVIIACAEIELLKRVAIICYARKNLDFSRAEPKRSET